MSAETVYSQKALALLHGVQSRRELMPNCTFELFGQGTVSGYEKGRRIHVRYTNGDALFIMGDRHVAMLKDDEAYYYFDGSCTLRDPAKPGIGLLFDPRVFGLVMVYQPRIDLRLALRLDVHETLKIAGTEPIEGASCTIVVANDRFGEQKSYWISIDDDFRVFKCEHQTGRRRATIESSFDDSIAKGIIPRSVKIRRFDESGGLAASLDFTIENYAEGINDALIGLADLNMERGTPVTDIRIMQRIGYWDGREIKSEFPETPGKGNNSLEPAPMPLKWMLLVIGAVLAVLAAIIALLRTRTEG